MATSFVRHCCCWAKWKNDVGKNCMFGIITYAHAHQIPKRIIFWGGCRMRVKTTIRTVPANMFIQIVSYLAAQSSVSAALFPHYRSWFIPTIWCTRKWWKKNHTHQHILCTHAYAHTLIVMALDWGNRLSLYSIKLELIFFLCFFFILLYYWCSADFFYFLFFSFFFLSVQMYFKWHHFCCMALSVMIQRTSLININANVNMNLGWEWKQIKSFDGSKNLKANKRL